MCVVDSIEWDDVLSSQCLKYVTLFAPPCCISELFIKSWHFSHSQYGVIQTIATLCPVTVRVARYVLVKSEVEVGLMRRLHDIPVTMTMNVRPPSDYYQRVVYQVLTPHSHTPPQSTVHSFTWHFFYLYLYSSHESVPTQSLVRWHSVWPFRSQPIPASSHRPPIAPIQTHRSYGGGRRGSKTDGGSVT